MSLFDFWILVRRHDWTAWASDAYGVYLTAVAEKKELAEIAKTSDEHAHLWSLALKAFAVGANRNEEAEENLREFLQVWEICNDWLFIGPRELHPPVPDGMPF